MKEKLKLFGYEILFMLCSIIAAAAGALLQFVGKKLLAEDTSFMFAGYAYSYNIFMYLLGIILFVLVVFFAYTKHYKKTAEIFRKEGFFMKLFYTLLALILSVAMFAALIGCDLLMLGLTDDMRPEALFYLTGFGWPFGMFVFMMVVLFYRPPHQSPAATASPQRGEA